MLLSALVGFFFFCLLLLFLFFLIFYQLGSSQAGDPLAPLHVCPASLNASLTSRLIGRAGMPG